MRWQQTVQKSCSHRCYQNIIICNLLRSKWVKYCLSFCAWSHSCTSSWEAYGQLAILVGFFSKKWCKSFKLCPMNPNHCMHYTGPPLHNMGNHQSDESDLPPFGYPDSDPNWRTATRPRTIAPNGISRSGPMRRTCRLATIPTNGCFSALCLDLALPNLRLEY